MPKKIKGALPVNQSDLAAYAGVSSTLMSMATSGRHGNRQLSPEASKKLADLLLLHQQVKKTGIPGPSLRHIGESGSSTAAEKFSTEATYYEQRSVMLEGRLAVMTRDQQQDRDWLNTIDRLLEMLPEEAGERTWLKNQQQLVAGRIRSNNAAQVKLAAGIASDKAKAGVYAAAAVKLKAGEQVTG